MMKIDFKKYKKELYSASAKKVALVKVPAMQFLVTDGQGDPNSSIAFQTAVATLYGCSFTVKFSFKKKKHPRGYFDFVVPPLEALWFMKNDKPFDQAKKADWRWRVMIMQPDFITNDDIQEALLILEKKKTEQLSTVQLETFAEGLSVQMLHIGPYSEEAPTITKLMNFAAENGYHVAGRHHEIYISNPGKTEPAKLKTILRYPVKK